MAIRKEVEEFVALGPLPNAQSDEDKIALHQDALEKIKGPVTAAEAKLLIGCFGPDECYGLAWTLLHLIESAPGGAPLSSRPGDSENEWVLRLWARARR